MLFVKKNAPNSTSSPHPLHLSTSSIPPPPHLLINTPTISSSSHNTFSTISPPFNLLPHPAISQPPPRHFSTTTPPSLNHHPAFPPTIIPN
ncbi:MAG: hypothetical protein IKO85_08710 [Bacteroidaceae bacterium]|nr:hypothetical protein [Bacteroidaceae bacterium]